MKALGPFLIPMVALLLFSASAAAEPASPADLLLEDLTAQVAPPPGEQPPLGAPLPDPFFEQYPRMVITITPLIAGPQPGEMEMHLGAGFSFGYLFLRKPQARIGVDVNIDIGVPVMSDSSSGADDLEGVWIGTSVGVPIRIGPKQFTVMFRPGICIDYIDYYKDGYDWGHWEDEIDSEIGFGITLSAGIEFNIHRSFALGMLLGVRFLPVSPTAQEYWNGGYDGTYDVWFVVHGGVRFMIRF